MLRLEYDRALHPSPQAFIFPTIQPDNFRRRTWGRILERAGLEGIALKDLRDTYASHLLTAGVQLGYVSAQLGHADVAVTAKHYAKWCGGDTYTAPIVLSPSELPADILARLTRKAPSKPPHGTRHGLRVVEGSKATIH
jgi:integrase